MAEKPMAKEARANERLPFPCLTLVTDRHLCHDQSLAQKVEQALAGGVGLVELREKDLSAARLLALAHELQIVIAKRAPLVINDRPEVALVAGAAGVHLPEEGLPVAVARRLAGGDLLIGRSVHSVESALKAQEEGADYLFVGTIFPSRSHPGATPVGLDLLRRVTAVVSIPCLAIGGVTAENVGDVMRAGAVGAAVISAILATPEPKAAAEGLVAAMASVTGTQNQAWSAAR